MYCLAEGSANWNRTLSVQISLVRCRHTRGLWRVLDMAATTPQTSRESCRAACSSRTVGGNSASSSPRSSRGRNSQVCLLRSLSSACTAAYLTARPLSAVSHRRPGYELNITAAYPLRIFLFLSSRHSQSVQAGVSNGNVTLLAAHSHPSVPPSQKRFQKASAASPSSSSSELSLPTNCKLCFCLRSNAQRESLAWTSTQQRHQVLLTVADSQRPAGQKCLLPSELC